MWHIPTELSSAQTQSRSQSQTQSRFCLYEPLPRAVIFLIVKLGRGFSQLSFVYILFAFKIFLITYFCVVSSFEPPLDHHNSRDDIDNVCQEKEEENDSPALKIRRLEVNRKKNKKDELILSSEFKMSVQMNLSSDVSPDGLEYFLLYLRMTLIFSFMRWHLEAWSDIWNSIECFSGLFR